MEAEKEQGERQREKATLENQEQTRKRTLCILSTGMALRWVDIQERKKGAN